MCSLRGAIETHRRWLQFSAPPAEQMLGLPGVRAAKVLAQDQLDGGGWLLEEFRFLSFPSFSTQRQVSCSFLSSGINIGLVQRKGDAFLLRVSLC